MRHRFRTVAAPLGRISWLVHVGASVVGIPKALSGSRFGEATEQNARVDAEIAFRVLRLMECVGAVPGRPFAGLHL